MRVPQLNSLCYAKVILHALKYPHCAVVGLLIGEAEEEGGVVCVNAVPCLHESAALTMALEVALTSVDTYCSANALNIVGVYFCNESLSDNSLDPFAVRVAEKVATNFANAILVQIDNSLLSIDSSEPAIRVYANDNKAWKQKKFRLDRNLETLSATSIAIQRKLYREIIDFENHLDNPANDFWNLALNEKIEQLADGS
ncbi:unnamed protein product [Toxocara canis]|nr:unnamed protein product [Toxocara canis]